MKSLPKSTAATALPLPRSHGGARPGAGRKPRALRFARQVAKAERALVASVPTAVACLAKAAQSGDVGAARYILDRVLGRPKEQEQPLADDMRAATDNPRLHDGWNVQERETMVSHWFEARRREGQLSGSARTIALAIEISQKLAWEEARTCDPAEAERLLAERGAREAAMREIVLALPRDEWDGALAAWERSRALPPSPGTKPSLALTSVDGKRAVD